MASVGSFGKYEVIRKVGQGGFGVVFEGRDPVLNRHVAIKTCSVDDEEIRKRFYREARIAGNLRHPYVVTVYDLGTQDGVPFLVEEYLPGEDLGDKIKRRESMSTVTKLDYLIQVAEGLEYAHGQGVIHRDIKPANIRILEDGSVKIMDFGLAKLTTAETQLTRTGSTMGTAGYLSPEQIHGERADLRADIFSFGVVSYELFAGRRPFRGDSISAILFQIIGHEPEPLEKSFPACPPKLAALVSKCLAKGPPQRYPSFAPVLAELRAIREELQAGVGSATREVSQVTMNLSGAPAPVEPASWGDLEKRVREAIDRGDLSAAELELTLARKKWGGSPSFAEVFDPVAEKILQIRKGREEDRQKTEKLAALLERARELRRGQDLEEAELALQAALELDPPNREVQSLLRSVGEGLNQQREAARLRLEAKSAASRIGDLITQGDHDGADAALAEALRRYGPVESLPTLLRRLNEAKRRERDARVQELVARAETLEPAGQLEESADLLRAALKLYPAHNKARGSLARVNAAIEEGKETERRERAVATAMARLEGVLAEGAVGEAEDLLAKCERKLGAPPFREQRARLDALKRQRKEAEKPPALAPQPAPVLEPGRRVRPALPVARAVRTRGAVAAALLLGAALALWVVGRGPTTDTLPTPTPGIPSVETSTRPSPSVEPGPGVLEPPRLLILNALPWAEVTEVVDAAGKSWLKDPPQYTPIALPVPAGVYSVVFTNSRFPDAITAKVTVEAGKNGSELAVFERVDPTEYFKRVGL